jgi:hypothetical protein
MSARRSISFNDDEKELLDYFENNGKSKIVKTALQFYMNNKDNVINEATLNILKILNSKQIQNTPNTLSNNNLSKLKK